MHSVTTNQYNLRLPLGMVETRHRYGSVAEFLKTNKQTTTTPQLHDVFINMPDFLCWKHYMLFTSDDVFIEYNSMLMYRLNFYQASQIGKAWPVWLGIISGTLFLCVQGF